VDWGEVHATDNATNDGVARSGNGRSSPHTSPQTTAPSGCSARAWAGTRTARSTPCSVQTTTEQSLQASTASRRLRPPSHHHPPQQTPGGAAGPFQGCPARQGSAPGRLASALAQGRSLEGTGAQLAPSNVLSCQGFAAAPLNRWIVASPTVRAELKGRQKAFMVVEHPCGHRSHLRS
jgi:hypothetical protein